jgi:uncharacterized membrane protein HdeD (DUF308 family)
MSGYGSSRHGASPPARNSISVPFVIVAAILAGVGLFLLLTWLITSFDWVYFIGVAPLVAGALMLFDRRAGSDSAE